VEIPLSEPIDLRADRWTRYVYFVSYAFKNEDGATGYGNIEIVLSVPVHSFGIVKEMTEAIADATKDVEIVILNYIPLSED
jgi:hypothetical protein